MEQYLGSTTPAVLVGGFQAFVGHRTHFEIHGLPCDLLVLDEAHQVTNPATDPYQLVADSALPQAPALVWNSDAQQRVALLLLPAAHGAAGFIWYLSII